MPEGRDPAPVLLNQYQAARHLGISTRSYRQWCARLCIAPVRRTSTPRQACLYDMDQVRQMQAVLDERRRRLSAVPGARITAPPVPSAPPHGAEQPLEDLLDVMYLALRAVLREWEARRAGIAGGPVN